MALLASSLVAAADADRAGTSDGIRPGEGWFQRVTTMPVYENSSADEETVAEIAAVTGDGRTAVYTDSSGERLGLAGIGARGHLTPLGTVDVDGEPTSVDVVGEYALVAVDRSESFIEPSGALVVVDLSTRSAVAEHDLGGQPDAVDISGDGRFAAIAIENERDEDLGDGGLPQLPAGYLSVVDLDGDPGEWTVRRVELTGLADVAPEDPEPEYVAINGRNEAVVTLQENNHIAIVDLAAGEVRGHFSAGTDTLDGVDTVDDGRIAPDGSISGPREPDAVAWLDDDTIGTADEGDWRGGTRTWTAFDARTGEVVFSSGTELEDLAIRHGQYPDHRADNKGAEPEGIAVAEYGRHRYAFVGLERANLVAVYNVDDPHAPELVHGLPTGVAPEGLLPVPQRKLLLVASEEDDAGDGMRSSLATYRLTHASHASRLERNAAAPSIISADGDGGAPIGFGALSGLSAVPGDAGRAVAVTDNAYQPSRILTVDVEAVPAVVEAEQVITRDSEPADYDLEAVAAVDDGYWLASEGNPADGTENLLVRTDADGVVQDEVSLPAEVAAGAVRFGFEGVAVQGEHVWVAIQREWADNEPGQATLARYTPATGEWAFAAYPLDGAPDGGWVGLSDLTAAGGGELLVLERDNQRAASAEVKMVYRVDVSAVSPVPAGAAKPVLAKEPVLDLLPALRAGGGEVPDKPEGLALVGGPGRPGRAELVAVVDNDGLDDATGESIFLRLGRP
ncbi:esterase-like activity of phytase family protein [Actinobacteria bacterium YIM 96077]|uniref:Alkaline phosphatase n=1 Tax=Phytoactinopolyspora halophila TaxID=1981511 RepID=A0A329QAA6_9ACTN|nr:esterase-like activity of phytase family protein [Actinobacteria bacterium YIM 96077]RAW09253.1 alkaline phosphatase [Phytoactinopolyspora halophila]